MKMHSVTFTPLRAITAVHLLASAFHVAMAADTFPLEVQFSLEFPRHNETYDISSGVLPVIFSITNQHYANALSPIFDLIIFNETSVITKFNHMTGCYEYDFLELVVQEAAVAYDPYLITYGSDNSNNSITYLHHPALNVSGLEGSWYLVYSIELDAGFRNDSSSDSNYIIPYLWDSFGSIVFTTRKGTGASLDGTGLARATANTSCADVPFSQTVRLLDMLPNRTCADLYP